MDEHQLPHKPPDRAAEWTASVKMLRRLLRDGLRLRRRADFTPERYRSRIVRIDGRLGTLAHAGYDDPDAARLAARLRRHQDELFTFLDRPEADWNNNLAERMIRPAVVLRKNSQCNRSQRGAATRRAHDDSPHPQTPRPRPACGHRTRPAHMVSNRLAPAPA
ncbi:MAG: transposase [Phycisphaerales bacterium]